MNGPAIAAEARMALRNELEDLRRLNAFLIQENHVLQKALINAARKEGKMIALADLYERDINELGVAAAAAMFAEGLDTTHCIELRSKVAIDRAFALRLQARLSS